MSLQKSHIVIRAKGGTFWEGGRQYTRNLLQALFLLKEIEGMDFDISLMVSDEKEVSAYTDLSPGLKLIGAEPSLQAPFTLLNKVRWKVKSSLNQSLHPRREEFLTSIGTTFAYPAMTASAEKQSFRSAEWIPDFQYKHFPEGSNPEEIAGRKAEFSNIADNAQSIVLSSYHAERDCHEVFPKTKERTAVLQFRVFAREDWWLSSYQEVRKKYNLPEQYFLVSNLLAPTKNHLKVIEALKILKDRNQAVPIVFTGSIYDYRNPHYNNEFLSMIHELGVHNQAHVLGLIPKVDQFQLLRGCIALVQPSLFEGWHTGVEEARLLGKRLVLSDIPVHREQDPPYRIFFPAEDAVALADAMVEAKSKEPFSPDLEREAKSIDEYKLLQIQYAKDFLEIANI